MEEKNCIFCKIISGEITSATVYEDKNFRVILDISPASKGHAIILPKNHVESIFEMSEEDASKIFVVASKLAKVMKESLGCEGLNVLQNNGEIAGQTVFHFHMHLIPRYREDKVTITWNSGEYEEDEKNKVIKAIKEGCQKIH